MTILTDDLKRLSAAHSHTAALYAETRPSNVPLIVSLKHDLRALEGAIAAEVADLVADEDDMLQTIAAGNRAALEAAGLDSGWDDHPTFPRADWAAEVANGDTWLGYPQWVAAREFDTQES